MVASLIGELGSRTVEEGEVVTVTAPCGVECAAGTCDGACPDCAEWPKVCAAQRESKANGRGLVPCPPGYDDGSCVGCPNLRAEVAHA